MKIKTVADLLEALEGVDPETEIKIAIQPSWPLEASIANLRAPEFGERGPLWIAMSDTGEYAPRWAWSER